MPLPGTRVIHDRFSEHHRPVATGTMRARIAFTRAGTGPGAYNEGTGKTDPPARVPIGGALPCRIQPRAAADRIARVGDQLLTLRGYLVTLPHDAPDILVDDLGTVTAADDALLVGRVLKVLDVVYASEQWERDLTCEDDLG
jgi:hypothetical protein